MALRERQSGLRRANLPHPAAPAQPLEETPTRPTIVPSEPEAPELQATGSEEEPAVSSAPEDPIEKVTTRLRTSLHKRLKHYSTDVKRPVQDLIEEAVTEFLQKKGG